MTWLGARAKLVGSALAISLATVSLPCPSAHAQSVNTATAEALFEQGRDLLRAGNAAEACPKLAESQRLDPATGTLLALAMCHEAEGKFASAWVEFVDVEARSRNENRADRQQVASEHAQTLRPRLSTLTIAVTPELAAIAGLEIRRDGVALGRGAWNTAVPVDSGEHVVEVAAPERKPWRGSVTVKAESDARALTIPALEPAPPAPNPAAAVSAPSADRTSPRSRSWAPKHWGALEWTGVGAAGAGVVALGVGGYFLSSALSKKSDSSRDCNGDQCGPQGFADRSSAVTKGNTATWFGIAGGALALGGATLFVVGRTLGHEHDEASAAHAELALSVGPAGVNAGLSSSF